MKALPATLIVIETFAGLSAVASAVSYAAGVLELDPADLEGTFFSSYTVPMLILGIVLGGGGLLATILLLRRARSGPFFAFANGCAFMIWILIQITMIEYSWLQILYFGLGLVIVVLAFPLCRRALRPPAHGR